MKLFFSLYSKILIAFLAIALIPFFLLGFISRQSSVALLEKVMGERLLQNVSYLKTGLFEKIAPISQNLHYWADLLDKQQFDLSQKEDPKLQQFLEGLSEMYGTYAGIYLADASGNIVAANDSTLIGQSIAQKPWFQQAQQGESGFSRVEHSLSQEKTHSNKVLSFYSPIKQGEENEFQGIMVAEYLWSELFLNPLVAQTQKQEAYALKIEDYIIDQKGDVVQAPIEMVGALGEDLFKKNLIQEGNKAAILAARGQKGVLIQEQEGVKFLVGYGSISDYFGEEFSWGVISAAKLNDIYAPIKQFDRILLFYTSSLVVVILLLAFMFASGIAIPIKKLTQATQKIAKGQKAVVLKIGRKDEIGDLAHNFQEMEKSLADLQSQLIHTSRLAAVGELAAGVAHEINNPLAAILGNAQLLLLQLEKEGSVSSQKVKEACLIIEQSSLRCKKITEGLLRFSGRGAQEKEPLDLNDLINHAIGFIQKQLEVQNITLVKVFTPELPLLMGNKNQIEQVILNFISNARDSMIEKTEAGTLTIKTFLDQKKSRLVASFEDTGSGISEANKVKVFQPFFTTKQPGKGTGLGLALSHGIIEDHGGKIEMESEEGKGTVFRLIFPIEALKA